MLSSTLYPQKQVFNKESKPVPFVEEVTILKLKPSEVKFPAVTDKPTPEIAGASLTTLLPSVVDMAFKFGTRFLEKRKQSFSAEYIAQNTYTKGEDQSIPDLTFEYQIKKQSSGDYLSGLKIVLKAQAVPYIDSYFYYVKEVKMDYSRARSTQKHNSFDLTLEIKPIFIHEKVKKTQELAPITINSIHYGTRTWTEGEEYQIRTGLIPRPTGAYFAEASVKVIQTNPAKLRIENYQEVLETYKGEAKTIINNILPKEKESAGGTADGGPGSGPVNPHQPDSNK